MFDIISPHIDDAAFSLCNYISELNESRAGLKITTCFSISGYHIGSADLTVEQVTSLRKSEDAALKNCLNESVQLKYLDLDDAPIRGHSSLLYQGVFSNEDQFSLESITNYMFSQPGKMLIVPLGLGNHIDHIICHEAAITHSDNIYAFYEDLPYAGRLSETEIGERISYVENKCGITLKPSIVGHSFGSEFKSEVCRLYSSQVEQIDLDQILKHWTRIGGERLWVIQDSKSET